MQQLKAYWQILATSAREDGANPKRLISSILQQLARILLVVAIYHVAYSVAGGSKSGLSYANAMWTIALCFAFFLNLGIRNIARLIDLEVRHGAVETGLIKPVDWRVTKLLQLLGKSGVEFLLQLVVTSVVLLVLVGPPTTDHLTLLGWLAFIPLFLFGAVIAAALFTMVGLSAFWLNDATSVFRIVDKIALIICGSFVPLALLPPVIQSIASWSPFGVYAAPTRLFDPTIQPVLGSTIVSGIFWSVVMLGLCELMWRRATRKIEVNGG